MSHRGTLRRRVRPRVFNPAAKLDASQVEDRRGRPAARPLRIAGAGGAGWGRDLTGQRRPKFAEGLKKLKRFNLTLAEIQHRYHGR